MSAIKGVYIPRTFRAASMNRIIPFSSFPAPFIARESFRPLEHRSSVKGEKKKQHKSRFYLSSSIHPERSCFVHVQNGVDCVFVENSIEDELFTTCKEKNNSQCDENLDNQKM